MDGKNTLNNEFFLLYRNTALIFIFWIIAIAGSLSWNIYDDRRSTNELAKNEARTAFNKDQAFRLWATSHGGVYVKPNDRTPPNPYLSHIPDRDVTTTDGKLLTLMNPTYMLRQAMNDYEKISGVKGHLTSLKFQNHVNKPDPWEQKSLLSFEKGPREVAEFTKIGGVPYLRFMKPMITKKGCLKCHIMQGYKEGQILGGLSISVPMGTYNASIKKHTFTFVWTHVLIFLLGMGSICLLVIQGRQRIIKQKLLDDELNKSFEEVEKKVGQRTSELKKANEDLQKEILDRKHAQEMSNWFGYILEESLNEIYIFDNSSLRFIRVNKGARENLGYSMDELFDLTPLDLNREFTRNSFEELIAPLRTGEKNSIIFNSTQKRKDGSLYPVETHLQCISYETVKSFIAIILDITERKQAEETVSRQQQQLVQAAKMAALGSLVSGVAHEINNPINLIMFNIPLIRKVWQDTQPVLQKVALQEPKRKFGGLTYGFLEENFIQLINDMEMASNRVTKIIKGLKHFSRQSSIEDKTDTSVNRAVENALTLAQTSIRKSGVSLELELMEDMPTIEANPQNIEQVVLNLTINAVEAIEHDNGNIRIVTGYDEEEKKIFISVSDNGRGIDPNISDKIFDPFFTDKQAQGGTGLGLSITFSLVQAHNGKITFTSELGEGTTFTISLPTTQKEKQAKILIADDDPSIRKMLLKALSREGSYEFESAANGNQTCIKLGTFQPDLLILDIEMPQMDGVEVCRYINAEPCFSEMKVIIITGYMHSPKKDELEKLGFNVIFHKPLVLKEFREIVGNMLT